MKYTLILLNHFQMRTVVPILNISLYYVIYLVIYLFTSLESNILYTYDVSNAIQYSSSDVVCYDRMLRKAIGQYPCKQL